MTQVTQEFSALVLRKEKTRPQLDKPETPHNTRGFQPYKARDRPVSDAVQKVREHVSKAHKAMLRQGKAKCGGEVHSQNCGRCGSAAVTSHEGKTAVEGQLKLGRNASRRKDRRQAAGHGYEGGAVPAFDYRRITEKDG